MFDQTVHTLNRNKFPQAELDKYAGKCVAWSFDGTRILASGATYSELFREIDRLGLTEYALDFIDDCSRIVSCWQVDDDIDAVHNGFDEPEPCIILGAAATD